MFTDGIYVANTTLIGLGTLNGFLDVLYLQNNFFRISAIVSLSHTLQSSVLAVLN